MERALDLNFDEIIIGADLNALFYAYIKKIPLLFTRHLKPYKIGYTRNYENDIQKYMYFIHILSYANLIPFSDKIQTIRLESDNTLKVTTKQNYLVNITFNKLVISDDYKVEGLSSPIGKTTYDNVVVDYMGIDERNSMPSDIIQREERVINTILYSKVVKRKFRQKFITVVSNMTDEELKNVEFSESFMKLRMARIFWPNIKVFKHHRREIFSLGKNLYQLPQNISTLTQTYEELETMSINNTSYVNLLESWVWNN